MKSKYEQVLDLFLERPRFDGDDSIFTSYLIPEENTIDFIYATDGSALCRLPMNLVPTNTPYKTLNQRILQDSCNKEFNRRSRINAIELKNQISILEREPVTKRCEECEGQKQVEATYESQQAGSNRSWDISVDCPVCDGWGYVRDYKAPPPYELKTRQYAKIGGCVIDCFLLEKVVQASELLQEEIFLVYQGEELEQTLFTVGEVLILLMPSSRVKAGSIKFTLSLKEEEVNE